MTAMIPQDLLTAALTNLESLEHHVPKLDRPIYLMAVEQIKEARTRLSEYRPLHAPTPFAQPAYDD